LGILKLQKTGDVHEQNEGNMLY